MVVWPTPLCCQTHSDIWQCFDSFGAQQPSLQLLFVQWTKSLLLVATPIGCCYPPHTHTLSNTPLYSLTNYKRPQWRASADVAELTALLLMTVQLEPRQRTALERVLVLEARTLQVSRALFDQHLLLW